MRAGKTLEAEFAPHKIAHHRFFLYFYAKQTEFGALEDHAEERIGVGLCRTQLLCLNRCLTRAFADHSNTKDPTRRLKVAYVSPDLNGTHAGINYNLGEISLTFLYLLRCVLFLLSRAL